MPLKKYFLLLTNVPEFISLDEFISLEYIIYIVVTPLLVTYL